MTFLSILIVFVLVQWWGSGAPLHHDAWFTRWSELIKKQDFIQQSHPAVPLALTLLGPALVLLVFLQIIEDIFPWLQIVIFVPILLYCLGRGKFTGRVSKYIKAWNNQDWALALDCYHNMGEHKLCLNQEDEFSEHQENWQALHHAMVMATAYRGFERMFAVLFWFIAFGPVGALVYRMSALIITNECKRPDEHNVSYLAIVRHWLWAIEWPVVRVLGLSFGLTGNFVSCMHNWQEEFLDTEQETTTIMRHFVYGALNIDDSDNIEESSVARLLKACLSLLSRTLILWICVLAVATLLW